MNETDIIQILVVDDNEPIRIMLNSALSNLGYKCLSASSGEEALEIIDKNHIDVVITDIMMGGITGIELLRRIKGGYDSDVIVMTGYVDDYAYEDIIEIGASDFLYKPVSPKELAVRLKRVLKERRLLAERNKAHNDLKIAHLELQNSYLDTINRLVLAAEYKDEETGEHIIRISHYSALIAEKLGMSSKEVKYILYSSPMHDVGKIGIPDNILLKPGKLTKEEFEIMKTHTYKGANILADAKSEILKFAHQIALSHHEKWNGEGYPLGLSEGEISLSGRIVCFTDVFDALTSNRPYKSPYPMEVVMDIIKKERGEHFDPSIVDIFLKNINEFISIREKITPGQKISQSDFSWSERDLEKYNID